MKSNVFMTISTAVLILISSHSIAAEPAVGWRGNGTGLWPESKAPVEWHRLAQGPLAGMRSQTDRPQEKTEGSLDVPKGLISEWLVLGPLSVADSVKNFDDDLLSKEVTVAPSAGEKLAGAVWKRISAPIDDPMVFGAAGLPWVELEKQDRFERNRIYYAHAYIHSPRGGQTRAVVEHCFGLKAWVNGREVYRTNDYQGGIGAYEPISRHELANTETPAGRFEFDLRPGWNRLLLKISSCNRDDRKQVNFCLRLMDPPDINYESKNIRWMTELPGRSTSTPILVGDRIFLAAEPDLLVCVDKNSGKLLWSAPNNYYEAFSVEQRKSNPDYARTIDPLVSQLKGEPDRLKRMALRRDIQRELVAIDADRFDLNFDGHFSAHFGIVGFSMPTPVSDGKHIYVWSGLGVAACYDLDGRRKWITRVPTGPLEYGSSPALANGVLAVFLGQLYGLDAQTGKLLWTQPKIHKNVASLMAATLAGQQVFVSQLGEVIRPSDGAVLFRPRNAIDGGCWGPPVILGSRMHVGKYGVKVLSIFDFQQVSPSETPERWNPEEVAVIELDLPKEHSQRPDGSWLDRSTAGSPLIHNGLSYSVDIYGWIYVRDLEQKSMVYYKDLKLDGLMHYNAVPVAASPTLIGNRILIMDNQGTTISIAPGREFQVLARNRIETRLERVWPIPAQETLAYAPPITDGDHLYIRGERFLYCLGEP